MSRKANYVALGLILSAAIGLIAALKLWEPSVSSQSRNSIQLSAALNSGDDDEGYARAYAPRLFSFPQDHGPHPQFRTEWWYFTGNLDDRNGRPFGYQLTFFRICMSSKPVSPWQTNEFYTAHFALSDITGRTFHSHERFNRAAMGLAGAEEQLRVYFDRKVPDGNGGFEDRGGFWLPVHLWGPRGESVAKLLPKGARVRVEGTLVQDTWEDKDGETVSRIEVQADSVDLDLSRVEAVTFRAKGQAENGAPVEPQSQAKRQRAR